MVLLSDHVIPSYLRYVTGFIILFLFVNSFQSVSAYQYPDDERLLEKRSHELATWLISQLNQAQELSPEYSSSQSELCQPKRKGETNYLFRLNPTKRNSELINSLLRLPKTVNEVGRK